MKLPKRCRRIAAYWGVSPRGYLFWLKKTAKNADKRENLEEDRMMLAQGAQRAGWIATLTILALACQGQSKKKSQDKQSAPDKNASVTQDLGEAPKGFLTDNDLKKLSNVKALTAEELTDKINKTSEFFPPDADTKEESPTAKCTSAFWDSSIVNIRKKWAFFEASGDLTRCLKSDDINYKKASMKMFKASVLTKPENEVIKWNGKKLKDIMAELEAKPENADKNKSTDISNGFIETVFEAIAETSDVEIRVKTISRTSGPAPTYCQTQNDVSKNCEKLEITSTDTDQNGIRPYSNYQRLVAKNISGTKGDAYFSSGEIEFEINDWKGVIKFVGKDKPPTWTAQKGSSKTQGILTKAE
jgi:hypothetical protein